MKKKTSEKSPKKKMPKNATKNAVKSMASKPSVKTAVKSTASSKAAAKPASKAAGHVVAKKVAAGKTKQVAAKGHAVKSGASGKVDSKKSAAAKTDHKKVEAKEAAVGKVDHKKSARTASPSNTMTVEVKAPVKPAKKEDKKKLGAKKGKAKDADADEDDYVSDDDIGNSEIEEYQEELEAVEEMDSDDVDDQDLLDDSVEDNNEPEEIILTDAEGRRYCRVRDCDQISAVEGYCRYHYLLLWKKIQVRKKILIDGKLERYVEELTARYPDKFLEMIKKDLKTEKDFLGAIAELEIDESAIENEFEEDAQSFADEIRGMGTGSESPSMEDDEF